jgi:endonuclease G
MEMARARLAMREAIGGWLFDPNVTLIGLGWREHEGQYDEGDLRLRIHVREKLKGFELEAATEAGLTRKIPSSIGGFLTDVPENVYGLHRWGGWGGWGGWGWRPQANPRAVRATPLRGGISIGNAWQYNYGTLGALVADRDTGDLMCLSNWHVLVGDWRARRGQRIYQPGRGDGGTRDDTIATLTRDAMSANLDAAVATLTGSRSVINDQLDLGPVRGVRRPELGMELVKSGRQTEVTYGRVVDVEATTALSYAGLTRVIRGVTVIEQRRAGEEVSAGGDSGSVWLDNASKQAVGLHFAGSNRPEQALAIDIALVLDALNVRLVTET